jgi:hypothetical protein
MMTERLAYLGWRVLCAGRQPDGRYRVLAKSCGHYLIACGESRHETWAAIFSMALKLTEEGHCCYQF